MKAKLLFAICCWGTLFATTLAAQTDPPPGRFGRPAARDSIAIDSLSFALPDTLLEQIRYSKDALDEQVDYGAKDSMLLDVVGRKVYLWGEAYANYTTIALKADYIVLDWETSIVTAAGWPDESGKIGGKPEFKDREQEFRADSMRYNFQTRKGKVYDVTTQQNDVVVKGRSSKFITLAPLAGDTSGQQRNIIFSESALFTTCTADHPHFGIRSSKQKVIPNQLVVVGPSNVEIMGVPTPLWLPFGFFPMTSGRSTGLLFPSDYEYSPTWGFGLRDVGWFFPLGDNFNLAVLTNIYLKGRWGVTAASDYRKRYKYNGNLRVGYESILNENTLGELERSNSIIFNWSHRQDRSAHPSITIGGSINIQSNNYQQRVFNDAANVLQNQLNSNFSFTKVWQDKPLNFSAALSHSQNSATRAVNITFPNLQFLTQTLYPFRQKERAGQERWYETITLRYTADARTSFTTTDTTMFTREMFENGQYGMRQTATSGTSFKLFKYFNLNPQVDYGEVWYFNSLRRRFDPTPTVRTDTVFNADLTEFNVVTDTTRFGIVNDFRQFGFETFRNFSASMALNTQLFGTLQFRKGWLRGLRHVAKINTTLSYAPGVRDDLNYIRFTQFDTRFPDSLQQYSIFQGGIFGAPPQAVGQQLTIGYGINNIFEAKIRKDTVDRKIKLFDNLNVGGSYNIFADSLNWSPVSANGTARFFKGITTLSVLVRFDPYALGQTETGQFVRVNRFHFRETGQFLRFTDANFRFNTSIRVSNIRELFQGKEQEVIEDLRDRSQQRRQRTDDEDFLSLFENFGINHNFVIGWNTDPRTGETVFDLSLNSLNIQGSVDLTKNWRINIGNFGYDFKSKRTTYPSIGFSRDLHCWEMGMNSQPTRGTYSFFIQVKPGTMGFLKVPYQRNNADGARAFR
ncbi:MAG TPA: putative LPS assembly protein LptD [Saprospiraceae bacterium]|nr:putative LPS assembly protein LptD [Saprospiraceae bacterium]HMP24529.1 putative LPS assembly protein LptD [Saprospiraceae bacterium]